ncbi:glycosyltransferase family 2 protein [Kineococcus sp. SYSU DK005]|uniref:glycosyltransferase family 2 protein n=1 Tax=Kineococcus sp. SYSU DK005 TaxID=3383126 RepID=UPI003D7C3693
MTTPGRPTERADDPGAARVAVVVASKGRPAILAELIDSLQEQTRGDFTLVLSVPDTDSLPSQIPANTRVVHDLGSSAQRNAGLDAVPDATHVFFFDDDAVVREDYLERGMAFFAQHPEVVAFTGRVLLDGAVGDAIPQERALAALASSLAEPVTERWRQGRELYGCNFAYRRTVAPQERFDERLPLYGWLEDHDFARRLMRYGVVARVDDCVVVHRGVKSGGRTAHERLGYSQVMNPCYLMRKGSFPLWLVANEAGRRVAMNVVKSTVHQERAWRRRRLRGNVRALADVARGRFTPERILDIPVES